MQPDFLFSISAKDYVPNADGIVFDNVADAFRNTTAAGEYVWCETKQEGHAVLRDQGGIMERFRVAAVP